LALADEEGTVRRVWS